MLRDVDIVSAWNAGRAKAEVELNKFKKYQGETCDFASIAQDGFTMLIPYGRRKIRLNPTEVDYSLDKDEDTEDAENHATGDSNSNNDDAADGGEGDENDENQADSISDMIAQPNSEGKVKHDPQIGSYISCTYKFRISLKLFNKIC